MPLFHLMLLVIACWLPLVGDAQPLVSASQAAASRAPPEAEFHMGRLIHAPAAADGWRRSGRPWWAIDWPEAENHFLAGLRRLSRVEVADDSRHLRAADELLFDYPFLFVQQVGHWTLNEDEVLKLREYLQRGGFMVVDDFHGPYDWQVFESGISRVLPGYPIVDLQEGDDILHILYELNQDTQIPGQRHLYRAADGSIQAQLQGPQAWRAIFDENGHMMVAINYNMDMGDAWQHADDPYYPEPMTALAYRFGVNYVLYAMTH